MGINEGIVDYFESFEVYNIANFFQNRDDR
jgi:hypothetical protein